MSEPHLALVVVLVLVVALDAFFLLVGGHRSRADDARAHGQRMGHVGLSPRGLSPVVYTWTIDAAQGRPEIRGACGEVRTLQAAKRRVEAAFRRLYSWRFRASRGY